MNNSKNKSPFWQMYIGIGSFTFITFILMIVVGFHHVNDSIIQSFDQTIQQPNNSIEQHYKETSIALQKENVKLIKSKQKLEDKIKKLTSILVKEHKSENEKIVILQPNNSIVEKHTSENETLVILQVDNRYTRTISELMTSLTTTNWTNADYWDQTRVINRIYADKQKYPYVSIKSKGSRRPAGKRGKVMETLHYLMNNPDVDWVFFLDSDAFVGDDEMDFKMVKDYFNVTDDIHMLFATEKNFVNSGVYFARNSEITKEIMSIWLNAIRPHTYDCDQVKFNEHIISNETYRKYIRIPQPWTKQEFVNFEGDHKKWDGYHEAFVQHYFSYDREIGKYEREKLKNMSLIYYIGRQQKFCIIYSYSNKACVFPIF